MAKRVNVFINIILGIGSILLLVYALYAFIFSQFDGGSIAWNVIAPSLIFSIILGAVLVLRIVKKR